MRIGNNAKVATELSAQVISVSLARVFIATALMVVTSSPALAEVEARQQRTVTVATSRDLMLSLQSDTIVHVQPGTYYLDSEALLPGETPAAGAWEKVSDGQQLVVTGTSNLTVVGFGETPPKIFVKPAYANVLTFRNSQKLTFRRLHFEHDQPRGYCVGGVLHFKQCADIQIDECVLRGSGTEGITLLDSRSLMCQRTVISDCTYGIMTLLNASKVSFQNCDFHNCSEYDLISISRCKNVQFDCCEIRENTTGGESFMNYALFRVTKSKGIAASHCYIHDNKAQHFSNSRAGLKISGCKFKQNWWRLGKHEQTKSR